MNERVQNLNADDIFGGSYTIRKGVIVKVKLNEWLCIVPRHKNVENDMKLGSN